MIVDVPEAVLRRALESFRREGRYGYPESQFQRVRMKDAQTLAAAIQKAKAEGKGNQSESLDDNTKGAAE